MFILILAGQKRMGIAITQRGNYNLRVTFTKPTTHAYTHTQLRTYRHTHSATHTDTRTERWVPHNTNNTEGDKRNCLCVDIGCTSGAVEK